MRDPKQASDVLRELARRHTDDTDVYLRTMSEIARKDLRKRRVSIARDIRMTRAEFFELVQREGKQFAGAALWRRHGDDLDSADFRMRIMSTWNLRSPSDRRIFWEAIARGKNPLECDL
jgi:hypothetical protein